VKVIALGLGAGTPDESMSGKWVDAVQILRGSGPFRVQAVHLQSSEPVQRSAFGEPESAMDHVLVILDGAVLASGGGQIRKPVTAGHAIHWPRAEGFLVFATERTTALLVEGTLEVHADAGLV
jgi:hypothetical protein